jgi:ABC-type dipeptide/oligopeptide/nickel transport systems, permease components
MSKRTEAEGARAASGDFVRALRVMTSRKVVVVGLAVLGLAFAVAIFAPLLAPYGPNDQSLMQSLKGPSAAHWLGTDRLGRDVLSRIIYGTRVSILIGFVSVAIAGSIGMLIGLVAGVFGGWIDAVLMRLMDVMMSIPMIILALFIGSALGRGLGNVMLSVGIALIPAYARLTRGQAKSIRQLDYVTASVVSGTTRMKTVFLHVLPNALSPNIVLMTMNLGTAILVEAGLSFLGLGIAPPTASLGAMVSDGYLQLNNLPLLSIAPGLAIMLIVLAFNIVGDALRDALDPRLRGSL